MPPPVGKNSRSTTSRSGCVGFGDTAQVHQDVGKLERTPRRRRDVPRPFPFLLRPPAARGGGHRPVGDAEGFEHIGLGQQIDAGLDAVRHPARAPHQLLGDLPAAAGERRRVLSLRRDPVAVLLHQRFETHLRGRRAIEVAERLHAELHGADLGRVDPRHAGPRHPLGPDPAAFIAGEVGARRDVVADRVLGDVAIVQIGEAFVPIPTVQTVQVHAGDQRPIRLDVHFHLKRERGVLPVAVRRRGPAVHREQRHRPGREGAAEGLHPGRPDEADHGEPAAARQLEAGRPAVSDAVQVDGHRTRSGPAHPGREAVCPPAAFGRVLAFRRVLIFRRAVAFPGGGGRTGFRRGLLRVAGDVGGGSGIGRPAVFSGGGRGGFRRGVPCAAGGIRGVGDLGGIGDLGGVVAPRHGDVETIRLLVHEHAEAHRRGQEEAFVAAPIRRARIVAAMQRLGRLVERLLAILRQLLFGGVAGGQKARQVPARRRLRQAFVLQRRIPGPRADEVDPQGIAQVAAHGDAVGRGVRREMGHGCAGQPFSMDGDHFHHGSRL